MSRLVKFRLRAYDLYTTGSVKWVHSELAPDGIICPKTTDLENPITYFFPEPHTGKLICGLDLHENKLCWGDMHCAFEQLGEEGWHINEVFEEPEKIIITL
jgi:hypothetical protein